MVRRMADGTQPDERIADLEIKVAYQDQTIAQLDALVRAFGTKLDELTREVAQLREALGSPEVMLGPPNEPPPHY